MTLLEFRPSLPGKQSDENLGTSLISSAPSELPQIGSRQLFLASSDVRYGSEAAWPRAVASQEQTFSLDPIAPKLSRAEGVGLNDWFWANGDVANRIPRLQSLKCVFRTS